MIKKIIIGVALYIKVYLTKKIIYGGVAENKERNQLDAKDKNIQMKISLSNRKTYIIKVGI